MRPMDSASKSVLSPVVHGATVLLPDAPTDFGANVSAIYVETQKECWSYAVSFDLAIAAERARTGGDAFAIEVDLEVENGWIGVGCTNAAADTFIGREVIVAAGKRRLV